MDVVTISVGIVPSVRIPLACDVAKGPLTEYIGHPRRAGRVVFVVALFSVSTFVAKPLRAFELPNPPLADRAHAFGEILGLHLPGLLGEFMIRLRLHGFGQPLA